MKKLLISILAFLFSPIISAIDSAHEKAIKTQKGWFAAFEQTLASKYVGVMGVTKMIEQRQMEANYFLGGKAKTENSDEELGMMQILSNIVQQLNYIGRKAAMPLILTAKGVIINVLQCKKLMFECSWDHIGILQFRLMVDSAVADSFSFDLEKISKALGSEQAEDKPVFDFARVFLKKHTPLTNGKQNVSIVDHIAFQATRILVTYLPQREITFHANIDVVCYQAILSAIKPFYDKEKAANAKVEQAKEQPEAEQNSEEKTEQTNIFPLNGGGGTAKTEQQEKREH